MPTAQAEGYPCILFILWKVAEKQPIINVQRRTCWEGPQLQALVLETKVSGLKVFV